MSTRKTPIQALSLPVLSERMDGLERRVGKLEEADKEREDSNAGIRRELSAHLVEDAKTFGEMKTLISNIEERLSAQKWLLILLLGVVGSASSIILYKLFELASALHR